MRKILTFVGSLSLVMAGAALAQPGINLAWNDCLGYGGAMDRAVPCTNSAIVQNNLHMSFIVPVDVPMCQRAEAIIDVSVDAMTLPSWWQETNRWSGSVAPGIASCPGWYETAPSGPMTSGPTVFQTGPRRLRIGFAVAVASGEEQHIVAGDEYLSHVISLRYGPGTFNDPGCLTPACFCANDLLLLQPEPLPATRLENPSMSNTVSWRGGGVVPCYLATPAKLATWGSIKALYR